ncbi:MAG: SRPBCC family protein [Alphaproteobacteria bacterium]|nr:SRPBCC family protein [Alphaproteobacteria bacterium]
MSERVIRLHRVLRTKPERVYRAFLDPGALAKWLPPYGFTCTVHHIEARVGGAFRMSFHNFSTGNSHSFGGEYLELVPNERLRYVDRFDDPNLPGVMEVTVSLRPVLCGTELDVSQAGIPAAIPLEMCYLGWQESLLQLANLVEPEIPG